jgi:hypothetical protein
MDMIKGVIDNVASCKLAVTAAEITLPVAIVAAAYHGLGGGRCVR